MHARIRPDSSGRFYIDKGCGVPLTTTSKPDISLADVPSLFMQQHVPDASPNNTLMPELIEQLQPHKVINSSVAQPSGYAHKQPLRHA